MDRFKQLPSVFVNMTASYKAYWFLAILALSFEKQCSEISIYRLCCRMLADAWYPVNFFRINFGFYDQISINNHRIKELLNLDADISKERLINLLENTDNIEIKKLVSHFNKNVTFRFLSPWIKYQSDAQVERDSQFDDFEGPYSIHRNEGVIRIKSEWYGYFTENYAILKDYGIMQLATYLQGKNQGVPGIIHKLIKPAKRESLVKQRAYWDLVIDRQGPIECIYTHEMLDVGAYDVEHYLPWSFVTHNLIWNLVPADGCINSSKGNKLPPEVYFKSFIRTQKNGLQTVFGTNMNHQLFEDFATFGVSVGELVHMNERQFEEVYRDNIKPIFLVAKQLGFQEWIV
ncbi:HNH endonuclease domain-containing protein [Carboxylicivirga marina]|uniref:HNH nuclease domain-containing protein n=1 Tax=Carboxylicivirga marina TaxID=2800988 RepID=A0ABS1HGC1_9BACT|nr:HNH endonuclease domain-containing protein [Carboxylicivirga marina]MBK3516665.1 hypothetical protein [Carboxylicivirga marina]